MGGTDRNHKKTMGRGPPPDMGNNGPKELAGFGVLGTERWVVGERRFLGGGVVRRSGKPRKEEGRRNKLSK